MIEYEVSKHQFAKKRIKPAVGKKVLFAAFSDPGIMYVKIKKVRKNSIVVSPCEPPLLSKKQSYTLIKNAYLKNE
jgi:hypothetical protein